MNNFFLLIELGILPLALWLVVKKADLAIIYLPVIIFSNNIIVPVLSASVYYSLVSAIILYCIYKNGGFYKNNIFAMLLFFYLLLLLARSENLVAIRSDTFSVFWLMISIPLIAAVYKKNKIEIIYKELFLCACMILVLFISNVLISTIYHYSPTRMYGITKGILYGNIYAAGFNILSAAIFIVSLKLINDRKPIYILLVIISYCFVMLSLRRSVMLVSSIGMLICLFSLLFTAETRKFILAGTVLAALGFVIYSKTGFMNEFKERYELRKLDERALENEPRFFEYQLVYKDMFVYNAYSPLIGFRLFSSAGNYGKGIFELRSLHGDLPSIAHSSGIIGVVLYLLAVLSVFRKSLGNTYLALDKAVVFFSAVAFLVFTTTGRFTECGSMILIFLVATLPLAQKKYDQ